MNSLEAGERLLKKIYKDAISRQTPKAPDLYDYGAVGIQLNGDLIHDVSYLCPTCGSELRYGECCHNNDCGQLIDWAEWE